jgi:hypothetical protein
LLAVVVTCLHVHPRCFRTKAFPKVFDIRELDIFSALARHRPLKHLRGRLLDAPLHDSLDDPTVQWLPSIPHTLERLADQLKCFRELCENPCRSRLVASFPRIL